MVRRHIKRTANGTTVTEYEETPNGFSYSRSSVRHRPGETSSSTHFTSSFSVGGSGSAPSAAYSGWGEAEVRSIERAMDEMPELSSLFRDMSLGGARPSLEPLLERPIRGERKETERERAQRLFEKEKRAQERLNERIRRANGDDYAPPNPFGSSGSGRSSRRRSGSLDGGPGYNSTGYEQRVPPRYASSSSRAAHPLPRDPFDMFEDTLRSFPFSGMRSGMPGGFPFKPFDFPSMTRDGVPPLAGRTDEEYLRSVRDEFERTRRIFDETRRQQRTEPNPDFSGEHRFYEHLDEGGFANPFWAPRDSGAARAARAESSARASRSGWGAGFSEPSYDSYERQEAREARRAAEREAEAERQRRARRLEKERAEKRAAQRAAWQKRCAALFASGDIQSVQITFQDIPWPIYALRGEVEYIVTLEDLSSKNVKEFLLDLARDNSAQEYEAARRKVLKDAIRMFHPDRWHRVLPRVRENERESVKTGVELCSRIINDLLSQ